MHCICCEPLLPFCVNGAQFITFMQGILAVILLNMFLYQLPYLSRMLWVANLCISKSINIMFGCYVNLHAIASLLSYSAYSSIGNIIIVKLSLKVISEHFMWNEPCNNHIHVRYYFENPLQTMQVSHRIDNLGCKGYLHTMMYSFKFTLFSYCLYHTALFQKSLIF